MSIKATAHQSFQGVAFSTPIILNLNFHGEIKNHDQKIYSPIYNLKYFNIF